MKHAKSLIQGTIAAAIMCGAAASAVAQDQKFSFGPPLRSNHVFAYKYTERVTTVHEISGSVADSSERTLTYYITQHQFPTPGKNGMLTVQANIDSMMLEVRTDGGQRLEFNTQTFAFTDGRLAAHREVLVPSSLVNRLVTFNITPYGEILSVDSRDLENVQEQAKDSTIDEFTRTRLAEITTDQYLASVFLPWRMLPVGRQVEYNEPVSVPLWMSFDRLSFKGTGTSTLAKSPDGDPVLRFEGRLSSPVLAKITTTGFDDPLTVKSANANVAGELTLESDGVVRRGWTAVTGSAVSDRHGIPVNTRIRHEAYIETIGVSPLPTGGG